MFIASLIEFPLLNADVAKAQYTASELGFFLSHVKRMRERPTRRPGDHQRVNAENKNDADEGDA